MTWLEFFALTGSLGNAILSLKLKKERVVSVGLLLMVMISICWCEGWV